MSKPELLLKSSIVTSCHLNNAVRQLFKRLGGELLAFLWAGLPQIVVPAIEEAALLGGIT